MGTPSYMAPEQAAGQAKALGPAADIYALGAILYECLTGRPPFKAATMMETLDQVRNTEPVPPSRLQAAVPRDLETICLKCLEKDPRKRYPSAGGLADDLRRFLAGEPILARPAGAIERTVKWVRRKPVIASLIGGIAASLIVGIGVASWSYQNERQARQDSDYHASEAKDNEELANTRLGETKIALQNEATAKDDAVNKKNEADAAKADADEKRGLAEKELNRSEHMLYSNLVWRAKEEWSRSNVTQANRILDECRWDLRGWEWYYLRKLCHSELRFYKYRGPIRALAVSPDGQHAAVLGETASTSFPIALIGPAGAYSSGAANQKPGFIEVHNYQTGALEYALTGLGKKPSDVWYSQDGQQLAFGFPEAGKLFPGAATVLDASTGRVLGTALGPVHRCAISPEGLMALAGANGVEFWSFKQKRSVGSLKETVTPICFSPDGRRLAGVLNGEDGKPSEVLVWQWGNSAIAPWLLVLGAPIQEPAQARVLGHLATADQLLRTQPPIRLKGHRSEITGIAFSPDHTRLASCSRDHTVKIWDVDSGKELWNLAGHQFPVLNVAFSRDGSRLASVSGILAPDLIPGDGEIKIWDVQNGLEIRTIRGQSGSFLSVAWSADGNQVITGDVYGTLKYWDAVVDQESRATAAGANEIFFIAVSPDGKHLAASAYTMGVAAPGKGDLVNTQIRNHADIKVWQLPSLKEEGSFRLVSGDIRSLAFAPDGKRLYISRFDPAQIGTSDTLHKDAPGLVVWDVAACKQVEPTEAESAVSGSHLAYSPDGTRLASNHGLFDAKSGKPIVEFKEKRSWNPVSFSPDGKYLATWAGNIEILKASDGTPVKTLKCRDSITPFSLTFNEASTLLAAATENGPKVWRIETGENGSEIPETYENKCWDVAFSRDGRRLVSAQDDGKVVVWDLLTGQAILELRGGNLPKRALAFSPDGNQLYAAGFDKNVRVWNADAFGIPDSLHTVTKESQAIAGKVGVGIGIGPPVVFGADDQWILGPSAESGATIWNAKTGRKAGDFAEAAPKKIEALAFNRAGTLFATAAQERTDLPLLSREEAKRRNGIIDFGPFSKDIVFPGKNQIIRIRDAKTFKETLAINEEGSMFLSLAFSPDGSRLAGVSKNNIKAWAVDSGKEVYTLPGSTQDASAVCYSPDGQWIATGSWQDVRTLDKPGEVRVWNAATGNEAHALKEHNGGRILALAFSHDSKWLAAATGKVHATGVITEVEVWEVSSGKIASRIGQSAGMICSLAFRPDGKELATGSFDGIVRIWDPSCGLILDGHLSHPSVVSGVAFSHDGGRLLSASSAAIYVGNLKDRKLEK
jgi:WD40 repeat protein